MNVEDIPLLGGVFRYGVRDRVFAVLMVLGPILIVCNDIVGRNPVTLGLGVVYVVSLPCYVLYKALSEDERKWRR
ncbi:MAG: hypothetical protein ABEI77_10465 [Halorientalis sp.]